MASSPAPGRPHTSARARIDGPALARAFSDGAAALREQADALNAINVFPVPDGDTGTNMSLTMKAAIEQITNGASSPAEAAKAAARGALLGAKGNSGVILSQIIAGFASAMPHDEAGMGAADLALAFERGREMAYKVVSNPKEGTILTAITAAAEGARDAADAGAEDALQAAVAATHAAVLRTPELLPVLKEAGVVDAGAQGLYVLLDGMLRSLRGEAAEPHAEQLGRIDASWLAATERTHGHGEQSGYCTEFVVSGSDLSTDEIRARLAHLGNSVIVVSAGDIVRVHVHTHAPEEAFAYGRTLGTLSQEKAEDMEAQFQALAAQRHRAERKTGGPAVVAVGAGAGIEDLLRSIGATEVVHGGQTMNPSAGDIRAAIEATGADDVIVLPNNKNIIMAAEVAAAGLPGRVRVLPSRSIPQGVAALVAMNPEAGLEENVAAMEQAIASVHTGEVTLAARATHVHGIEIAQGQPIGLVDGDLVVAAATVAEAARECVRHMIDGREGALVTLYAGAGQDAASAEALAEGLRGEFGVEVEVVDGGQPHYPYLIGVE